MEDTDLHDYATDEILRDGSSIHVRAIRPDDKLRLTEHFRQLSERSVYFRFFGAKRRLTEEDLQRFTEPDMRTHVGLVATLRNAGEESIIGVGRFMAREEAGAQHLAEVAFAVADAHQGRGIGTVLLEHLAAIAQRLGVTEFEADVLGENNRMLEVFRRSGFQVCRSIEAGVVHVRFPTAETDQYIEASTAREKAAAAQSVRNLLEPRAIAVVGASRKPETVGSALVANLKRCGFTGPIYPINPSASEIEGLRCYPDLASVQAPIDLAIIAVPAPHVHATVEECARAGVRAVLVISAGFAEVSGDGRRAQDQLRDMVRASGMRMVGPNCMGVVNTAPSVSMNATFAPAWPPAGNVGMLSQSGALGLAILDYVRSLNAGISTFVSVGNKADVSGNDLLCYWDEDPNTDVILLYLESFGNPRKFARIAPDVARHKPIVAVKSGRSAAGTRAASSHSASLANLDVAVDALFEQAGVIRTASLEEMFDVAVLLATQPVPAGPRVGVVTNAGGPGILFADACEAGGLQVPELTSESVAQLRSFLPAQAGLSNPIDMIASATAEQYERTVATVGNDPQIDAVVVIYIPLFLTQSDAIAAAITRGAAQVPSSKPVLTVFLSSKGAPPLLAAGERGRLPSFTFPENAANALAKVERYGRWRERPAGSARHLDSFAQKTIRAVVDRVFADDVESVWLDPRDAETVLRAAGIHLAVTEQVLPGDAVATAERLGYPLVAKVVSKDILHKSDVGGVILGLDSSAAVAEAVGTLQQRVTAVGATLEHILLQRQVDGGIEALVGVTTDPTFGPLIVCGLGGVMVELLRDVSFCLTPVTDRDASEMIRRLRGARLLDGYRGAAPGDREALIDLILRISALVETVPELQELDLNPVKVLAPGAGVVAVDCRMRLQRRST